jgi:type II secretory pathway component GspD/PulD (secretin)
MQFTADTITDIQAVVNLLASNTTSDILSTPSIITIDNEEGRNNRWKKRSIFNWFFY